ncbi:MAG: AAA family ATPase [Gemmatimonadetes bacterium]|nr:AAA family ATPase [Gemmatimonadota bacterium]
MRPGSIQSDFFLLQEALSEGDLAKARQLWRGEFLDGLSLSGLRDWDRWAEETKSQLEDRFVRALTHRSESLHSEGDLSEAIVFLETALDVKPAHTAAHRARMEILLELGQLDSAREALTDARATVDGAYWEDFGLDSLEKRLSELAASFKAKRRVSTEGTLEFVGRSQELAKLRALWKGVLAEDTRFLLLTGPAGIGKTRLAEEFVSSLGSSVQVVRVKGYEYEAALEWGVLSELSRKLLSLPGAAGMSSHSTSILKGLAHGSRGEVDQGAQKPGGGPITLVDAIVECLDAVSFESPIVLLLDDGQWIDESSRMVLFAAMRRIEQARVLFAVLGRPEGEREWGRYRHRLIDELPFAAVCLEPISRQDIRELLSLHISWPTPRILDEATRHFEDLSSGNPLFIAEIFRDLRDKKIIDRVPGGWAFLLAEFPKDHHTPANIRSLLLNRLDRLSVDAGTVATRVAQHGRPVLLASLTRTEAVPDLLFDRALSELLDENVLIWTEDSRLDFSHDLLREAALHRSASSYGPKIRSRLAPKALIPFAAILIGALALWGSGWFESAPISPLYGGGTIVFGVDNGRQLRVPVTSEPPGEWAMGIQPQPSRFDVGFQTYRGPDGEELWFHSLNRPGGPAIARLDSAGSPEPVIGDPRDQTLRDVSPSGSQILFTSEDVEIEEFAHLLRMADLDGSNRTLLLQPSVPIATARISPDGDRVAVGIRGEADTLAILNLSGQRTGSLALGPILAMDWCGGEVLVTTESPAGVELLQASPESFQVDTLSHLEIGNMIECSPDGSAALHLAVSGGRVEYVIRDLENGEVHPLGLSPAVGGGPQWVRSEPTRVVEELDIGGDSVNVSWGSQERLDASVLYSDGTRGDEGIQWFSSDPGVASVSGAGLVIGNRPGRTLVIAGSGHSHRDTTLVVVEGGEPPGVQFHDQFDSLSFRDWLPVGYPRPYSAEATDGPELRLTGDDKYFDGLLSLFEVSLNLGVTIDLEFRLNLDREAHQKFAFCLDDGDPMSADQEVGTFSASGQSVCFLYPSRESDRMDPAEASFFVEPGPAEVRVRREELFPQEGWVQAAIQIRADGHASLILNHEVVATNPVRIDTHPKTRWTVRLDAEAVGTEVAVRNLVVWAEPRY